MGIEFNGNKEIRISNPDVDPKSKALIAQDTVKLNPSEIGDLLRSRGAQSFDYIDEDKICIDLGCGKYPNAHLCALILEEDGTENFVLS